MRIWELCYYSETGPDGYERHYFTSRRAAADRLAELRRDLAEAWKKYKAWEAAGGNYYDQPTVPTIELVEADITPLDFRGTPRQMVLSALRYRA